MHILFKSRKDVRAVAEKKRRYRPGMPLLQIPSGHLTAGFKKILNKGYGAIRREAQEWLDVHVNNLMGEDAEKVQFYSAVVIVCDAASIYVRRYGEKCLEMAAE